MKIQILFYLLILSSLKNIQLWSNPIAKHASQQVGKNFTPMIIMQLRNYTTCSEINVQRKYLQEYRTYYAAVITERPDGSIVKTYPDGTIIIIYPDGSIEYNPPYHD